MLRRLAFLSGALLALCTAAPAGAFTFSLSPTNLQLDPAQRLTTQTTLRNLDREAVTFTVEVVRWSQVNGQDVLEPTDEVVVNPASFTLKPGGTQVIRVGVRKRPDRPEMTYRLLLKQQPAASAPAPTPAAGVQAPQLNVVKLLHLSLPIYVSAASSKPDVSYGVQRQGQDLVLQVNNTGDRRATLRDLVVRNGAQVFNAENRAVLAKSSLPVVLPGWAGVSGNLNLTFTDASGQEQHVSVPVPAR